MGLFSGTSSVTFKTEKPFNEVAKLVEGSLETIGSVEISEKGLIAVDAKRFDQFSHKSSIHGSVRERDGNYYVELNYSATMEVVGWILVVVGLFCYGIGLLVLIFPFLSKNEMKKKTEKALDDLRFEFK
jgi:hypothetical protein